MIWAVAVIEAGFIAVCVYQIRELTSRINTSSDMVAVCVYQIRELTSRINTSSDMVAVCVYQIRELTSRINTSSDMVCRIIALCEKMNDQHLETAQLAKDTGEAVAILNGKVSNNEHRIRDIYKAINQMKGWPTNEVK